LDIATGWQASFEVTQIEYVKKIQQAPTSRNPEEGLRFINRETQWN
jgi:hypothetical protein